MLFWLAFVVFVIAAGWTGHHHFFGVGYFRPAIATEMRILDLGEVLPDTVVETEFFVTNGGWRSLQIMNIRTGCASCVRILSFPKEPIRGGEAAPIRFAFDSTLLRSRTRQTIIILSNDPVQPIYSIMVDAVIQREEEPLYRERHEDVVFGLPQF